MHYITIGSYDDHFKLEVDGSFTFRNIIDKIIEKEHVQQPQSLSQKIQINVCTSSQVFDLNVEIGDTLDTILSMIQEKEAISKLELLFTFPKVLLRPPQGPDDDLFYFVYWVIVPAPKLIQINVRIVNDQCKAFSLEVKKSDTIGIIKDQIYKTHFIKPSVQRLYFAGMLLDNDGATLSDYNIHGNFTLDLAVECVGPLQIFVELLDGKKVSLHVTSLQKISKVKSLIRETEGLSPGQSLTLVYAGEKLDDRRMLTDYNIQDRTILCLVDDDDKAPMMMQIHVKIVTSGKTISLEVKRSNTIHDVKTMIQSREDAIPDRNQILFLPQKRLEDELTLAEYYIRDQSTLHLETSEMEQYEGGHVADCSVMES